MALDIEPKYPNRRKYVLKMRSDATPDRLSGLLENIVTGEQYDFSSGIELMDAIAFELQESPSDDPKRS